MPKWEEAIARFRECRRAHVVVNRECVVCGAKVVAVKLQLREDHIDNCKPEMGAFARAIEETQKLENWDG